MQMKTILIAAIYILLASSDYCKGQNLLTGLNSSSDGDNYKVNSFVFTGKNATMATFNIININKEGKSKTNGGFAILTGLAQIIFCGIYSEKAEKGFSILNYTMGTATAVIGGIRLFKKDRKQKDLTLYPYSFPTKTDLMQG